jgi:actin-related protein 6
MPLKHCATRIDVGGKLMTNLLMEVLSYKEINLKGEGHIVEQIKESCSFVSERFSYDMEVAKAGGHTKEFVLPDFKTIKRGFIRNHEPIENLQIVKMTNERFTVPEVLFSPSDIGIN